MPALPFSSNPLLHTQAPPLHVIDQDSPSSVCSGIRAFRFDGIGEELCGRGNWMVEAAIEQSVSKLSPGGGTISLEDALRSSPGQGGIADGCVRIHMSQVSERI